MPSLLTVTLPNGEPVLVEPFEEESGAGPVGLSDVLAIPLEEFMKTYDKLLVLMHYMSDGVRSRLQEADEISMEFGVKLGADVGLFIAKSQAEVNFKIAVKWKKDKNDG